MLCQLGLERQERVKMQDTVGPYSAGQILFSARTGLDMQMFAFR